MRTIFHCDINNCFASIEMAMHPELRQHPLAVCGDPSQRRGIVLAKSESAKKWGVRTGDTVWRARQKCPDLRFVLPHFEIYERYSAQIRAYYEQYTPQVEPYGIDECWLDVTDCVRHLARPAEELAHRIRMDIHRIFGVTISVGVSFNKAFAKLGSDMKKPDAVTCILPEHFREQIWPLPVSSLFGAGRSTTERLGQIGVKTIGQLACSDRSWIRTRLGKNGEKLWCYANGLDDAPVTNESRERQSLSHGTTLNRDVFSSAELWPVIEGLSDKIAFELQEEGFAAQAIQIYVRDSELCFHQYQMRLSFLVEASRLIAEYSLMLLSQGYDWRLPIRAVGIRLFQLEHGDRGRQLPLFGEREQYLRNRREKATDGVLRSIQSRFGETTIYRGGREQTVAWCHPPGG